MKFTLSWLNDYLDTQADAAQIAQVLTAIGLEVESVTDPAANLSGFTVAEILSAEKHPDADKLKVCRVLSDAGELQIVCGAPNARAGLKVALAKIGAVIPNGGFTIKQSKIRGVESCGMLCSADELGLGTDSAGIIELPVEARIGQPVAQALGLDDPVFDIAVTPNRGDCLGVYGIARDLAAAGIGALKPIPSPSAQPVAATASLSITLQDSACPLFIGTVIRGVTNGPAPDWMQRRLKAVGLRPISALVDITNYINLTYARPLHVYDLAKLQGGIVVRQAIAGEQLAALNDKSYTLAGGECVIADASGVLGLGGIIGGVPSSVTENTTDILLECAWFDPMRIAQTGRAHSIDSDARYRFERIVDPGFVATGAALATQMILDCCGGRAEQPIVAGQAPDTARRIAFDPALVERLGGVSIPPQENHRILDVLGFTRQGQDIIPPSFRPDIEGQADLVEEILRIHGYDRVPVTPLPKTPQRSPAPLTPSLERQRLARLILAQRGLQETHHWAFMAEAKAALFGFADPGLRLINPISADLGAMRPSLLPHLLDAAARNAARGFQGIALFEIGPQFHAASPSAQATVACGVRAGIAEPKQWLNQAERPAAWLDAKADALAVLEALGVAVDKLQTARGAPDWYHPGRSGVLSLGPKQVLARFGELHPMILKAFDCEMPVAACELFLDAIPATRKKPSSLAASDFQPVERDFAFILDEAVPAQDLLRAVAGADKQLVQSVRLFDAYQGKGIAPGKKSLALTLRLQAADRTLRDEEIEAVARKVIAAAQQVGAQLRG